MEANNILHSDLLDILFENRNKEYGAYELRRKYNKRIALALLITAAIGAAITLTTFFSKAFASKRKGEVEVPYVVVHSIDEIKPLSKIHPPQIKNVPPPQVATSKLTSLIVMKKKVKDELQPVQDIINVDVKNQVGSKEEVITPPPVDVTGVVVEPKQKEDDPKEIVLFVQIEASVDVAQWRRYLENKLQHYIEDAANAGMASGQYTVQVKFLGNDIHLDTSRLK